MTRLRQPAWTLIFEKAGHGAGLANDGNALSESPVLLANPLCGRGIVT